MFWEIRNLRLSVILLFLSHPTSSPGANHPQKKSTIQSLTSMRTATTPVQRIISCLKYCSSHLNVHLEPLFYIVARKILLKPFPPVASLVSPGKYRHSDDGTAIWFDVPILTLPVFPLVLPDTATWAPYLFSNVFSMFLPWGLCTGSLLSLECSSPDTVWQAPPFLKETGFPSHPDENINTPRPSNAQTFQNPLLSFIFYLFLPLTTL